MPASPLTPVTLLTGHLGSGKTTLLNRWLKSPALADSAVLINEFGEVPVDHLLVRESSENITVLVNGCLCCSVAGDLVKALRELYFARAEGRVPAFRRVVIETSGLADPAPILHTLIELPLASQRYALSGIVCTLDAEHGASTLMRQREAVKQLAMAERIVVTKDDRVEAAQLEVLKARAAALNPTARLLTAREVADDPARVFDTGLLPPGAVAPDVSKWLNAHAVAGAQSARGALFDSPRARHEAAVRTFVVTRTAPLDWPALEDALLALCQIAGERLLRLKGIVAARAAADTAPIALHAVQHMLYPAVRLARWPDDDQRTRLVFITRDLDENSVLKVLADALPPA